MYGARAFVSFMRSVAIFSKISYQYSDVIMGAMASQITGVASVYSTVCSCADQRKHQSSASLAFVRGIHRSPGNSPHKGPVTRKMFLSWAILNGVIWRNTGQISARHMNHVEKESINRSTLKTERRHGANFVVTGNTEGCHNDKQHCGQWRQSWHHDNTWFSV